MTVITVTRTEQVELHCPDCNGALSLPFFKLTNAIERVLIPANAPGYLRPETYTYQSKDGPFCSDCGKHVGNYLKSFGIRD